MARSDDPSSWQVSCGGPFQQCGFIDVDTGAIRIPQKFEAVKPFENGLAAARAEGHWGYIDRTGFFVVPAIYDEAVSFFSTYAQVRVGADAGVIDRRGRVIIPPRFRHIVHLRDDVFVAVPAKSHGRLLTLDGNPWTLLNVEGAGLYHRVRGWLTDTNLSFSEFNPDLGLIWARPKRDDHEQVWGLMRADGSWQTTPRYSHVQRLSDGRAVVQSLPNASMPRSQRQTSIRSGAVDESGRLVVPLVYEHLAYWRGGYGIARRRLADFR